MSTVSIEDLKLVIQRSDIKISVSDLRADLPLIQQGFDSLDLMNLFFLLEELYKVKIDLDLEGDNAWNTLDAIASNINLLT